MAEQTFEEAVRESRLFYRRRLAERLAVAMVKRGPGLDVEKRVVGLADRLSSELWVLEDEESKNAKS